MKLKNPLKYISILREKAPLLLSVIAGLLVAITVLGAASPKKAPNFDKEYTLFVVKASNEKNQEATKKMKALLTAYSSTPEETDDTPFITASGKKVIEGIVANNLLPFGTKIRIPELYGDKVFIVEDRMHRRKSPYHFDIWFPTKEMAVSFGVKIAEIEILEN